MFRHRLVWGFYVCVFVWIFWGVVIYLITSCAILLQYCKLIDLLSKQKAKEYLNFFRTLPVLGEVAKFTFTKLKDLLLMCNGYCDTGYCFSMYLINSIDFHFSIKSSHFLFLILFCQTEPWFHIGLINNKHANINSNHNFIAN